MASERNPWRPLTKQPKATFARAPFDGQPILLANRTLWCRGYWFVGGDKSHGFVTSVPHSFVHTRADYSGWTHWMPEPKPPKLVREFAGPEPKAGRR
jgi:hypothetical protein